MNETPKPYNLNLPSHLIANEVLRRINGLLWENGEKFQLEGRFHTVIQQLVIQYQEALMDEERRVLNELSKRE